MSSNDAPREFEPAVLLPSEVTFDDIDSPPTRERKPGSQVAGVVVVTVGPLVAGTLAVTYVKNHPPTLPYIDIPLTGAGGY